MLQHELWHINYDQETLQLQKLWKGQREQKTFLDLDSHECGLIIIFFIVVRPSL